MTELEKILEPIKDYDPEILEDTSKDLMLKGGESRAAGIMLDKAVIYLINEDLKVR